MMRYKKLGKTGLEISVISAGTWSIGGKNYGEVKKESAIAALRTMVEQGVNVIDTAPVYNAGNAEKIVGEALEGIRDKVFISTKTALYNDSAQGGKAVKDGRYDTIMKLFEESCRNLRTDYIDIYFLHWPVFNVPVSECMRAMMDLKRAGKIGHIGVSNYSIEQIEEAQQYGDVEVIQPPYSMVERSQEDILKWAHEHGIGVMSYGSLGAGILTGAYRTLPKFDENDLRVTFYDYFKEPRFSRIMTMLKTLDKIAAARHASLPEVVLNWSTQKDYVDTAIIGADRPEYALQNCAGMGWTLNDEEMAEIDKAIAIMDKEKEKK